MELLRGTAPKVTFYGPTPDTDVTSVTYSVNGVVPVNGSETSLTVPTGENPAWEVQLPYLGADSNDIEVVWNFTIASVPAETFNETYSYEVVTPYLTKQEVKAIYPEATDEEAMEVEAAVRHVINAHTGQSFGRFVGTKTVEGHGSEALRLPERLVEITGLSTLSANLDPSACIIVSDGWYLKKAWANEISTIASTNQYWGDTQSSVFDNGIYTDFDGDGEPPFGGPFAVRLGGVVVAPGASGKATIWRDDYPFQITGTWGYKSVPTQVKEAAKLLVNDYACSEVAYRDRYLESIKAADWRLQFNQRAWEYTGNVRADQLLSEFVIMDWAVI